jgi:hypothetical protein
VNLLVRLLNRKRDFYAGGWVLFGLVMAFKGRTYRLGTLMHKGPSFMPTVLGVILIVLGIPIAAAPDVHDPDRVLPKHPQWWGWFCILPGPLLLIVFGSYGGMVSVTFACVFVSGLDERMATWKGALGFAAVVTTFDVLLVSPALRTPMPILEWRRL